MANQAIIVDGVRPSQIMERALMNVEAGHLTTVHESRLSTGRASFRLQRLGNISRYRVFVG
jgi:hypothetical protein